ncbi:MAG: hypothetical protein HC767_00840 [Akkermansiaceae bacterium]|nr:hypothetical protein [Akkermansiaceae bacterium]
METICGGSGRRAYSDFIQIDAILNDSRSWVARSFQKNSKLVTAAT